MRSGNSLVAGTLMLIGLPLLSGCAGVQVQSQFDEHAPFGAYRTFGWDTRLDEDPTTVDADLRAAARAGVEAVLRRKGFEGPTDRNPDFRVHYTLGVEVAKLRVQVDDGDLTQPDIITPGRSGVGNVPDHGKQDPQVTEPFDSDWQVEGFEYESPRGRRRDRGDHRHPDESARLVRLGQGTRGPDLPGQRLREDRRGRPREVPPAALGEAVATPSPVPGPAAVGWVVGHSDPLPSGDRPLWTSRRRHIFAASEDGSGG